MTRIVLRHLSGAKVHQESAFEADELAAGPIGLGRDPASRFVFDDADDAVSRAHARIERTSDGGFRLVDAGSANGSFVNGERVTGEAPLSHGDTVQLGRGGPQFSFRLDPAPSKPTRLVSAAPGRPTREVAPDEGRSPAASTITSAGPADAAATGRVGRATVERLITAEKSRSTRLVANLVAGVVALVGALGVWQVVDTQRREAALELERQQAQTRLAEVKQAADGKLADLESRANLSRRVKADYGASTVYVEVSWRLTDSASGRQIYHSNLQFDDRGAMPAYVRLEDGSYEPLLSLEDRNRARPIGGTHTGTGFVVSDNGLILTNRHVAAAWHAPYDLGFPGVVVERKRNERGETEWARVGVLDEAPDNLRQWVPSRSRFFRTRSVSDASSVTGNLNSMTVTFANSKLRVNATLGTISPEHDVALIKIDAAAGQLKKVELRDSYDTLASGDPVVVLGYPGVSAVSYVITNSSDQMLKAQDVVVVPEVSVNQGIVSKVVRGKQTVQSGKYVSAEGDIFEMSINSTGQGNSGGPVFDGDGKVVGIFALIGSGGRATLTGAVPIRYGLELLDPTRSATSLR